MTRCSTTTNCSMPPSQPRVSHEGDAAAAAAAIRSGGGRRGHTGCCQPQPSRCCCWGGPGRGRRRVVHARWQGRGGGREDRGEARSRRWGCRRGGERPPRSYCCCSRGWDAATSSSSPSHPNQPVVRPASASSSCCSPHCSCHRCAPPEEACASAAQPLDSERPCHGPVSRRLRLHSGPGSAAAGQQCCLAPRGGLQQGRAEEGGEIEFSPPPPLPP